MRPVLAGVLPQPFGRIQFRRVGRQLVHFQPMPVGLEPSPDLGVLVVGGVVLNQNRALAAVSPRQLLQEAEIGGGIEDRVLTIVEPCAPKFDGAEDLHVLALSRHRNFRRATYATPGRVYFLSRLRRSALPIRQPTAIDRCWKGWNTIGTRRT